MTTKNKHAEVATARSRLGATLQHLVDKKEESQPESEDEGASSQPDMSTGSPSVSPRKSTGKSYRKRKRKDDVDFDLAQQQHSYVMKLFDRSVDLAQFTESTPLYPICRAWMKNQPGNKEPEVRERSPSPEVEAQSSQDEEGVEKFPDVYTMPPPVKQETSEVCQDLRIPEPLPQTDPSLDIHADPDLATPPEQLLLNHMARWKQIRTRWRNQAYANELRYGDSLNLLKEMFDRQCKET
ncbi:protein lin-37 homolog [Gigantopelta aegis]|uniref:protein lin-37 homolog n=1 Tax=Gigantopelta aegis TaxID=1735272 RepID=UPI001B88B7A8|nr:protein lin-37 homolog [Gigantopelta aegis]